MPLEGDDPAYLWDMLETARTLQRSVADVSYQDYLQDQMLRWSAERALEIIGEAARRVSDSFTNEHPEISWRSIIGQRNVIAHQYGEIRDDRIWNSVRVYIPALVAALEPLVPPPPTDTA